MPGVVLVLLVVLLAFVALRIILRALEFHRLVKQGYIFLELKPPAQADKTPLATQRLFSVLHGLEGSRTALDRLFGRKTMFSAEIVASRDSGIRYIWRIPKSEARNFERTIASYWPDVSFKRIDEVLPKDIIWHKTRLVDIKQTGHFAYPLTLQDSFSEFDPMAYLTGAMTKLSPTDFISVQLNVSPVKVREANSISKRILHNEELIYQLSKRRIAFLEGLLGIVGTISFGLVDVIGDMVSGSSNRRPQDAHAHHKQQVAMKIKPARTLSVFEQKLAESVQEKLTQPLFRVDLRAIIIVGNKAEEGQRLNGLRDWLASFNVPKYQSLKIRFNFPSWAKARYRLFLFVRRLPAFFNKHSALLSAAELTNLYHFAHPEAAKTENIVKSLSNTLPAPISLKASKGFDVVLGQNHHHGTVTEIGLSVAERQRHVYIIGGTGNGKTTMMLYSMAQDFRNGKGFAFIDPHGDAAVTLLRQTPESETSNVVYFNPDDLGYPIGLNPLELTPDLTGDELLREKDLVTESAISIFRKIFSEDDSGGHRIEYVLRNAIQTALTTDNPTLFTVYDLLNDPKYRKKVVAALENKDLKNFWRNELGKAGGYQQVKMVAGITAKIGRFLFSASAKRIIEQPRSTIDFDDIINSGKVLICNFSKGLLGEDTSELFGIIVLAKLQMAALRRARLEQSDRKPFYVYVDEFQNFATPSFVQMLSEARKYGLYLVMAEQSTSQQDDQQMVNIILANVGTVICFRTGNPADEQLMLPLFSPYIKAGAIANLPSFNFYMLLSAIDPQEPFSGQTVRLESAGNKEIAARVIKNSRAKYAHEYTATVVNIEPPEKKKKTSRKQKTEQQPTKAILPDAK